MSQLVEAIARWVQHVIEALGYPGIVLVMALENVFPPIPSELVMPLAGFMASSGTFNIVAVVIAGMLGSVIGALILYYIGLWADEHMIRRFLRRWGRWIGISEDDLNTALGYFARHGEAVVFFGRLIPIIRSLISIPAGMCRMSLPRFVFYTVLGTTLWSGALSYAGWLLGEHYDRVAAFIERYQTLVLIAIGVAVLVFIYRRAIRPRLQRPA
ncbi:DedA family protein [Kallotenue papyrolyticum]|uniref:DedA family protein n=1 Tax=Kallotenue papyrolyticum TaxID=1325125 RepID=UPI0004AE786C|nr:DedA family protein [Kallotenue papyrolyticum]